MLQGGARGQNLGFYFFLLLFFLNGIIQFKQQVLFRIEYLSLTSDCRFQCPRVGLEVKIYDTPARGILPLRALSSFEQCLFIFS